MKEAPLQYQALASGVRVEGDNKKQHRLRAHTHTHTYTSTYLVHSTPCLFWKRKQCVTLHGLFHNQIWGQPRSHLETRTFLMRAFGQDVFQQTSWFSPKKNKTKRVFPRFPMSHLMEWLTRAVGTSEQKQIRSNRLSLEESSGSKTKRCRGFGFYCWCSEGNQHGPPSVLLSLGNFTPKTLKPAIQSP